LGYYAAVVVPDIAKDHGAFIFRGQEVPEDMNTQCHIPEDMNTKCHISEDMNTQCHIPEDLNPNLRFYKNKAKHCLYNCSIEHSAT
jgi:hypothetical protein